MGKRVSYAPGTFSSVDLATSDAEEAKRFYTALFGWQAVDTSAGEAGTYTMFMLEGDQVAAVYEQQRPAAWVSYVTVDDADATAARARELAGSVVSGPVDIVDAGRMALLRDPQGATFAIWQPRAHQGAARVNDPGCFCWNQLATTDPAAAEAFYRELFGWTAEPTDMGTGRPYTTVSVGGRTNGGITQRPPGSEAPQWLVYFTVESLDDAVARVEQLGGRVHVQPTDVAIGRAAVVADTQGAPFALFEGRVDD